MPKLLGQRRTEEICAFNMDDRTNGTSCSRNNQFQGQKAFIEIEAEAKLSSVQESVTSVPLAAASSSQNHHPPHGLDAHQRSERPTQLCQPNQGKITGLKEKKSCNEGVSGPISSILHILLGNSITPTPTQINCLCMPKQKDANEGDRINQRASLPSPSDKLSVRSSRSIQQEIGHLQQSVQVRAKVVQYLDERIGFYKIVLTK